MNRHYRFIDTESWTIYGCHCWLVAHYEISIFQLLARYNYKHFASLILIVLMIDFWKFKSCTIHGPGETYLFEGDCGLGLSDFVCIFHLYIVYVVLVLFWIFGLLLLYCSLRRRGHGRIVAGFTTIYAINDYHHQSCEFEPTQSWRGVLDTTFCDKVCRWLATGYSGCLHQWNWLSRYRYRHNEGDTRQNDRRFFFNF